MTLGSSQTVEPEEMRAIPECPNYFISNLGNVYRVLKSGNLRKLKQRPAFGGYLQAVVFDTQGQRVTQYTHRIVAQAFLKTEPKEQVNHKNGSKRDNRACNLEWATPKENRKHATDIGLAATGCKSKNSKLTRDQVIEIFDLKGSAGSTSVARSFGVSKPVILAIWHKKKYKRELADR